MINSEKQLLKKRIKRLGWFLLIVFLPAMLISIFLAVAKIPEWLNIMVVVIVLFVLFFLFSLVCAKLDSKKEQRLKGKKDPFSD